MNWMRAEMEEKAKLERVGILQKSIQGSGCVAQLVDQSPPTPEIRGSNIDISKVLSTNCTFEKTKIKKKRLGMAHL